MGGVSGGIRMSQTPQPFCCGGRSIFWPLSTFVPWWCPGLAFSGRVPATYTIGWVWDLLLFCIFTHIYFSHFTGSQPVAQTKRKVDESGYIADKIMGSGCYMSQLLSLPPFIIRYYFCTPPPANHLSVAPPLVLGTTGFTTAVQWRTMSSQGLCFNEYGYNSQSCLMN